MALSTKTGSFTKNAGTGAQAVSGVGFIPKVLLLWTSYKSTTDSISSSYSMSWGMTTGAAESYAVSFSSQGAVSVSNNSTRHAAKAITVVQYGETLLAEADLTSFDADGFTLDWTTNTGGTQIVHYLALGGSDITGQKVTTFTTPTSNGAKAVTGIGFKPDELVLFRWNPFSATAAPVSEAHQAFSLGVVDKSSNSRAIGVSGDDNINLGVSDYNVARIIKTDKVITAINTSASVVSEATLTSLDADGFTLNYTGVLGLADVTGVLALKGIRAKVGSFTSSSAITGVGFQPSAIAFFGIQRSATTAAFSLQVDLGATTGASDNQSATVVDSRFLAGGGPTDASGVDSTGKCITRVSVGPPTIQTQASLTSFDSDGFTLSWTAGTVSDIIAYLAFGLAPTIATVAASNVTTTGAQLNGTVNPGGSNATYYFEWGLTTAYGTTTAVQGPTNGSIDLAFNASLAGLLIGNTQYHFRAVTEATGVLLVGANQSFVTPGVDRALMVF